MPFGERRETQPASQLDERRHDALVLRIHVDPAHEGPVDLQHVHRHLPDPGEGGVAGPEVVDRDPEATGVEILEDRLRTVRVGHRRGLRDLDDDLRRIDTALPDPFEDPLREVGLPELTGREVEADGQIDVQLPPRLGLVDELPDHPVADRLDQTELLGHGDEVAGWHHRAVGLDPPDQRLHAAHAARREVEDGLVVQGPPLALHRLAEAGHEPELRRGVQGASVRDDVGVAPLLGLQHRGVRVAQEAARLVAVLRVEADPDRRGHVELRAARSERNRQGVEDPLGRRLRSRDRRFDVVPVALEVGEQEEERVAGPPGDEIGLTGRLAEPVGHDVQDLVAREPAERVVHEAEVVDVDADHGDGEIVMLRATEREVEQLLEHRPRGQAGELVVIGQERDLLVGVLHLRDIDHHAERERGDAAVVADHPRLVADPDDPPVLAVHPVVQREGLARLVVTLVLGRGSSAIVRMEDPQPQVRIAHPLVGRVAEQSLDLRAHVQRGRRVVERVDVRHGGDVLDDRPVPIADDLVGGDLTLPLDVVRDGAGQHPQQLGLTGAPLASTVAVVRAEEPPPAVRDGDRDRDERQGPLGGEDPPLRLREVGHRPAEDAMVAEDLDPPDEVGGVRVQRGAGIVEDPSDAVSTPLGGEVHPETAVGVADVLEEVDAIGAELTSDGREGIRPGMVRQGARHAGIDRRSGGRGRPHGSVHPPAIGGRRGAL